MVHLNKLKNFHGRTGPLLLIIMDGIGIGKNDDSNAVYKANTPVLDNLMKSTLYTQLKAHGRAVGMPTDDDMGNSEVGHNALGAGRIFDQGASLVKRAIEDGSLFKGKTWNDCLENCKSTDGTLHFIGLLSDGNVHSHIRHLKAMIQHAFDSNQRKIRVHCLLDGRDVDEKSALLYIKDLESLLTDLNNRGADMAIASGGGRMITTMDRYNADWSIVERGWKAHVLGEARAFNSASEAIQTYYDEDPKMIDQYLDSFVVHKDGKPIGTIENGDSVIFFNFRGDRTIELTQAFEYDEFEHFDRKRKPNVFYAGMMQYDGDLQLPTHYLVNPPKIDTTLSHYICNEGLSSFAISETQKYGHVTFFWNGNKSGYIDKNLETYVEIPSDKVPFDQKPDMKADEITEKTIELLKSGKYKFGRVNFPNGDMVGHTGVMEAVIQSVETTDRCVGQLIGTVNELNGITVILADHGNADEMYITKHGHIYNKTSHTLNPVPFIVVDNNYQEEYVFNRNVLDRGPGLANVASTLLGLLGFEGPETLSESLFSFS